MISNSPRSPGATSRPCGSTTRVSIEPTGLPIVPILRRAVASSHTNTVGPVSVMPKPKQIVTPLAR